MQVAVSRKVWSLLIFLIMTFLYINIVIINVTDRSKTWTKNRTIGPWLIWHHERISWNSADFMKSGRFHVFAVKLKLKLNAKLQISWNPADFIVKFGRFHEIWQISWWSLVDFMDEIWQISWNPVDFIHEIWQISWLILKNANLKM